MRFRGDISEKYVSVENARKIAKSNCGKSENFVFIGKFQIDNVPDTV